MKVHSSIDFYAVSITPNNIADSYEIDTSPIEIAISRYQQPGCEGNRSPMLQWSMNAFPYKTAQPLLTWLGYSSKYNVRSKI
jgi:hypothetical protein